MSEIVYKVVYDSPTGEGFFSFVASARNRISYKIGEKAFPELEGSKLFVFSSLDSAKKFLFSCPLKTCNEILLCKTDSKLEPIKLVGWLPFFGVENFWSERKKLGALEFERTQEGRYEEAPAGTFLVNSLTPLEVCK